MKIITYASLFIFHIVIVVSSDQIFPNKFTADIVWLMDATVKNYHSEYYSMFFYNLFGSCIRITLIGSDVDKEALDINLYYNDFDDNISKMEGVIRGNVINFISHEDQSKDCPLEENLHILYTDYTNLVVLMGEGGDSGPQYLILRSDKMNATFEERINVIKENIKIDWDNIIKVKETQYCSLLKTWMILTENDLLRKCKELNEQKRMKKISNYIILASPMVIGAFWLMVYGVFWAREQRNRRLIVPFTTNVLHH